MATVRAAELPKKTITPRLLILSPEQEQFWPEQAEQLAELTSDSGEQHQLVK